MFGLLLLEAMPLLVEVGVLLDLFTGVFVMGIIIHHINREFASISTRTSDGVEGISRWPTLLIAFPAADGGSDVRRARRIAGGRGCLPLGALVHLLPGRRGDLPAGRRPRHRGPGRLAAPGPAGQARSRLPQRSCSFSARCTRPATWRCGATGPTASSAPTCFVSLAMMTLVTLSHHLGLMWVAMEATTLATAPLHLLQPQRPLAGGDLEVPADRLGGHCPGPARARSSWPMPSLKCRPRIDAAVRRARSTTAPHLSGPWLHAAFVLLFVGYGTKMGLAPDAHLEAGRLRRGPGPGRHAAGRRRHQLRLSGHPAGLSDLPRRARGRARPADHDLSWGCSRWRVAAVFMVRQRDFKRMLAYSSVEHMGILVLGIGIGGAGGVRRAAAPHQQRPDQGRAVSFGGQHPSAYGSKLTDDVHGAIRRVPLSGALFLAGFLAITGSPPFGPVRQRVHDRQRGVRQRAIRRRRLVSAAAGRRLHRHGSDRAGRRSGRSAAGRRWRTEFRDSLGTGRPILLLMALVLLLGLYIPPPLESLLREAAAFLEVKP